MTEGTGPSLADAVRDTDVVPSPGPEDVLQAGDVLVAIGSQVGLEKLGHRLATTA